jgi:hypothetical protein
MRTKTTLACAAMVAAGAAWAFAAANQPASQKTAAGGEHAHHDEAFLACAQACDDCARLCDACTSHCAHMVAEGHKAHFTTLRTCQDCADFCQAASQIVAKQGPFSDLICTACADACKRCGDACAKFPDDPMMKQCADECRKCEKACRDMLKHAAHADS